MKFVLSLVWCWAVSAAGAGAGARLAGVLDQVVSGATDDLLGAPDWPEDYASQLTDGSEFDYIVVGAGAGGAAVASRLALAGHHVLLLEAGGDPTLLTRIPGAAMGLLGSDVDWAYPTIPNNVSCLSSVGQQCRFSRGRCLGGSSSINYMMYVRGNRADHDQWGVPGWGASDMERYYLKYEGLRAAALDRLPSSSQPFHNNTGIMQIEFFSESGNSWHERIFEGLQALNVPLNPDVNAESQVGVSQVVGYVLGGERMSTARAYLTNDEVKQSLKVAKNSRGGALIIDDDNVVLGINVITGALIPRYLKLYVRNEVILSAGAVGTPQILQLSGVGPAEHLQALGLPVRAALPVGDGLLDHVLPLLLVQVDRGFGLDAPNPFVLAAKGAQAAQWLATRTGPLASNGLTDVTAFINTRCYDFERRRLLANSSECELPSMQLIHAYIDRGIVPSAKPVVKNAIGFNDDIIDQISDANVQHALLVVSPVVLQARSVGGVRLASTDPRAPPDIFPNYLSDERDMAEVQRAVQLVQHLVETPAWAAHGARLLRLQQPGCPEPGADPAPYWRCYARHMTYSVYHAVGSAALGRVLDARGRVRGVRGVRVADASLAPLLPRGNTEAMVVATAEKIADLVLEDDAND